MTLRNHEFHQNLKRKKCTPFSVELLEELDTPLEAVQLYESPFLPPCTKLVVENASLPVPCTLPSSTISIVSSTSPDGPVTDIVVGLPPVALQITRNVPRLLSDA